MRAQRLDHWLGAHKGQGLRCLAACFDFECRALGRRSERLCPMADVMRYFRLGYPAPESLLCLTVGLWPGSVRMCTRSVHVHAHVQRAACSVHAAHTQCTHSAGGRWA